MTQNNNTSMATQVETFLIEETIELLHDNEALGKWNEKIAELGLEGQQQVLVQKDKSPIPFLWMNSALIATFETLCPTKVDVTQYSKTPIPLEILELVSLSKKEGYFDKIEIWYNDREKDPVCIGFLVQDGYKEKESWYQNIYSDKYLIGRWADVKASLDTLTQRAKELFKMSAISNYEQQIRDAKRRVEDIDHEVGQKFGNAMPHTDLPF